ncbi:hypothetical protein MLD38_007218 [Melastoma candidum]|uniref:Uncharacterized protein n=1 Tax=Melastoma candidum TaxID=119954 RepID=A0ACB9RQY4_9MYRT|nr:hypothetical protein MLD38_007218 [Melastoma candidum]
MAPALVCVSSSMFLLMICLAICSRADFNWDVEITWGADGHAKILEDGKLLTLTLDKSSGAAFRTRNQFLFGSFDVKIKLVPGDSAGTVTTYYLRSEAAAWDEIDLEFLGNSSGEPYVLHTNIYTGGVGNREQQFYLWFDPRADFHSYSVIWNPRVIIIMVDGTPIRQFKNLESRGVPYLKSQPMRIQSSLWNADEWATRGGLVKTDWSKAPFTASFRNLNVENTCVWSSGSSSCGTGHRSSWFDQELDSGGQSRLAWVRKNYMIYDYCTDPKSRSPAECSVN